MSSYQSADPLTHDDWQHLAVTIDGSQGTLEFFINNEPAGRHTIPSVVLAPNPNDLLIGKNDSSEYFHGTMDDVRVYSRVLNRDEITSVFRYSSDSHLIAKYDFERYDTEEGKLFDEGPNGYEGAFVNVQHVSDVLRTEQGEAAITRTAFRTETTEFVEIPADGDNKLQGDHLSTCTFAAWVKLSSGTEDTFEPVIAKNGVFRFGVRNRKACLELGDGTAMHALPAFSPMSDAAGDMASSPTEARSSDVADAPSKSSFRGTRAPRPDSNGFARRIGANTLVWRFEGDLRDDSSVFPFRTVDCESRTKNAFQIDSPYGLASASHAFFDADTALRVSNWNLTNNAGAYWYLRTGTDAAPLPQWTEGEMPITLAARFKFLDGADLTTTAVGMILGSGAADQGYKRQNWDNAAQPNYHVAVQLWGTAADTFGITCSAFSGQGNSGNVVSATFAGKREHVHANGWNYLFLMHDPSDGTTVAYINTVKAAEADGTVVLPGVFERSLRVGPYAPNLERFTNKGVLLDSVEMVDTVFDAPMCAFYISGRFETQAGASVIPENMLRAHYLFDDPGAIGTATTGAHDATVHGAPHVESSFVEGSYAIRADEAGHVRIPGLVLRTDKIFSFGAWVKPSSVQGFHPIVTRTQGENTLAFGIRDGDLEVSVQSDAPPTVRNLRATLQYDPTSDSRVVSVEGSVDDMSGGDAYVAVFAREYSSVMHAAVGERVKALALALDASVKRVAFSAGGNTVDIAADFERYVYDVDASSSRPLDGFYEFFAVVYAEDAQGRATVRSAPCVTVATGAVDAPPVVQKRTVLLDDGHEYLVDTIASPEPGRSPWYLVMNYLHDAGDTTPAVARTLVGRSDNEGFPIQRQHLVTHSWNGAPAGGYAESPSSLAKNAALSGPWGHASPDLFDKLLTAIGDHGVELAFRASTDRHPRVAHFTTDWRWLVDYYRDGFNPKPSGAFGTSWTPEADHSANLPDSVSDLNINHYADAMARNPFFSSSHKNHMGAENSGYWSVDEGAGNYSVFSQVWVRGRDGLVGRPAPMRLTDNDARNHQRSPGTFSQGAAYSVALRGGDVVHHDSFDTNKSSVANLFNHCATDANFNGYGHGAEWRASYTFAAGPVEATHMLFYQATSHQTRTIAVFHCSDPALPLDDPKGWTKLGEGAFETETVNTQLRIDFPLTKATRFMIHATAWTGSTTKFALKEWMIFGYQIDKFGDLRGRVSDASEKNRPQNTAPAQHSVLSSPGAVDGRERAMCALPTSDAYNALFLDKVRAHTGHATIGWHGNDRVAKAALNNGDLVYYDCHQAHVQNAGWHSYDAVNVFAQEHVVNRFRTTTYGADQTWGWMFPRSATTTLKRSARMIYQFRESKKLRAVRVMGHHSYKMSAEVVLHTQNADGDFARFKTIGTTARLEKDQFEVFELGDAVPEGTTFMFEFLCLDTADAGIGALELFGDVAGGDKGADRTGFRAASLRVDRVEGDVVATFAYSHAHTTPVTAYLAAYTYAREGAAFEIAHAKSFALSPSKDGAFAATLSHAYGPDGAHVALDAVNYIEVYGMVADPAVGMYRVLSPAVMQPTSGKTPFGRIRSLEYDPFDNAVRARFSAFSAYEPLLSARVFLSATPLHKIARDTLITLLEGIGTSDALQETLATVAPRYAVTEADVTIGFALDGLDDGAPRAAPVLDGALYYMGILLVDAAGSKELVLRPIPVKGTYRPIISAWGAGYDQHHELATGGTTDRRSWTECHAIKNWMANHGHLKVRELFTMHHTGFFWAIDNNDLDHIYGWGYNAHGEIPFSNANGGNGTGTQNTVVECDRINTELRRLGLSVVAVSAAQHAAYLLLSDGRVYGWGRNTSNILGGHSADNSTHNDLTVVDYVDDLLETEGATVVDIGTCSYTLFVYLSNNKAFYMGNNGSGRVGDGHSDDSVGVFAPCVTLNAKLESGYHVDAICGRMSTIAWRLIPQGGDRTQEEWWGAGASRRSYNGGWTGGGTSTLKRCDYLETTLQAFPDPLQYALAKGPTNWENWVLIDVVGQAYYFMGYGHHMHQSDTGPWIKNQGYNPASRPYDSVWASMTGHGAMIGLSATPQSDAQPFYDTRSILTSSAIRTKIGGATWEIGRGLLLDAVVRPAKTAAPTHWIVMATTEAGYTREQAIAYMLDTANADNIGGGTVDWGATRDFVQEPIDRMTGPSGNLGHSMSFPGGVVHLYAYTADGVHRAYTNVTVATSQPRIAAVTNADFNPYSDTIGARFTLFDKEHAPAKYYAALTESGTVSSDMDDHAVMTAVVAASRMVPEASASDENLQSTYADRLFVPPKAVLPKALRGLFPEVDTDAYRQLRDGDAVTVVSGNDSANGAAPSTTSFTVPWYMRQNQLQSGQSVTQWTLTNGDRVFTNGTGKNVFNGDTSASRVHFPRMYNYTSTFNVNGTDYTTVYHFRFFYEFAEETTINSLKLFNDTTSGCQFIREIGVYDPDSRYFAPVALEDVGGTTYVGDVPCFAGTTISDEVDVDVRFAPVTVGPGRPIVVHLGRKSDANLYLYELQLRYVVPPTHVPTHFKHLKITAKNDAADGFVAMNMVEVDHMRVTSASCSVLGEDDVTPVLGAPGAFVVDGTAATATRFDAVDLAQGDADRAVVAFVKASAGAAGTVVGMGQMRQDRAFNLKVTAEGKMRFQGFGMDYESDAVVADGQEHCVALVYRAATGTLLGYVDPHTGDGSPAWTFSVPRPLQTKGSSVWIGRDPIYSSFAPNAVILREGFVYETADGQTNPEYDYRTGELQIVNNAAPASRTFGMNGAPLWVVPDGFAFDESDEFYYPKGRKEPPACLKQYEPLSVEMATLRVSPGGSYHTVLTLNCQKMHTPKDVVFEVTLEESADEGATWTYVPGTKTWFGSAAHIQDTTVVNGVFDFGTNALVRPVITYLEDTGIASGYNFTWQPCISSINFVMREPDAAFAFARFGLSEMLADRTETYNAVTDPVIGQSIVLSPFATTAANQYTLEGDFRTEDAVVSDPSEISVDGTVTIHKPGFYAVQVHTTTARQANNDTTSDIPLLLLKRVPKAAGGFDEYRIKLEFGSKGQGGSSEPSFVNQYTEAMVSVDEPDTQFVLFVVWRESNMNTNSHKGLYHRHVRSTMTVLESTGDVDQLFVAPIAVTHGTGKTYGNLLRDNLLKQFTFGVTDPTNIPFYRDPNFTTDNVTLRQAKDGATFTGTDNAADVAAVVQIEVDGTYDFTFNLPELSSSVHGIMLLVNGDVEQTLAQHYGGMATRSAGYVLQGLPTHTWRGISLVAGDIVQVRYVFQNQHTNQGDVNITAAHTVWDEAAQTSAMNGALLVKRVGDASTYRTMPFRPTIHNTVEPFAFPAIDYPEVVSSANPPEILDGEVRNVAVYKERLLEANVAEYAAFYGAVSNKDSPLVMRSVVKDTVQMLFEEGAPHIAKVDGGTMDILVEYHTGLPSAFDVRLLPALGSTAAWSGADFYLSRDGEEWTLSGSWTRPTNFNAPVAVGQVVLPTTVPVADTAYDVLVVMENTEGTRVLGRYVPPQIPKQLTFRTVFGIGNNTNGQLGMVGSGSTTPFDLAEQINEFMAARPGAQIFAIYGAHYFAFLDVREGGQQTIYGLGSNNYNQLGCSASGQPYTELTVCDKIMAKAVEYGPVKHIAGGVYHSMVLFENGKCWAWGYGAHGQLAEGTTGSSNSDGKEPTHIHGRTPKPVLMTCCGYNTVVYYEDKKVYFYGRWNSHGHYGRGNTSEHNQSPYHVSHIDTHLSGNKRMVEMKGQYGAIMYGILNEDDGRITWYTAGQNHTGGSGYSSNTQVTTIVEANTLNNFLDAQGMRTYADGFVEMSGGMASYWHILRDTRDDTLWGIGHLSSGLTGVANSTSYVRLDPIMDGLEGAGATLVRVTDNMYGVLVGAYLDGEMPGVVYLEEPKVAINTLRTSAPSVSYDEEGAPTLQTTIAGSKIADTRYYVLATTAIDELAFAFKTEGDAAANATLSGVIAQGEGSTVTAALTHVRSPTGALVPIGALRHLRLKVYVTDGTHEDYASVAQQPSFRGPNLSVQRAGFSRITDKYDVRVALSAPTTAITKLWAGLVHPDADLDLEIGSPRPYPSVLADRHVASEAGVREFTALADATSLVQYETTGETKKVAETTSTMLLHVHTYDPTIVDGTSVTDSAGGLVGTISGSVPIVDDSFEFVEDVTNRVVFTDLGNPAGKWAHSVSARFRLAAYPTLGGGFMVPWFIGNSTGTQGTVSGIAINSNGRLTWNFWSSDTQFNYAFQLDTWYHVTCVYDTTANTRAMYVDGALIETLNSPTALNIPANTKVWIGLEAPTNYNRPWIGNIGPVAVHDKTLTAEEVAYLYDGSVKDVLVETIVPLPAPIPLASKDGVFEWSMDEQARQALTLHTKYSTGHLTLKTTETEQPTSTFWKMQIYDIKGGHSNYATFTQMYLTDDVGTRPTNKHGHGGTAMYDGIGETNANVYRYNHGWHITHQYESPMTPTTFVWAHKHTTDASGTLGRVPTRMRVWWSSNGTNGSWVEWGDLRITPAVSPGGPVFQYLDFALFPNGHPRVVTVQAPTSTPAQATIAAIVTKEGARLLENGAVVADTDKAMKLDGASRKAIQVHPEGDVTLYDGEVPRSFLEHRAMRTDAAFIEAFTSKVAPATTNVGAGTSAELTIGFTTASTDYTYATGATLVPNVSYTVVLVAEDAAGARTLHVEPMTPSVKVPLITHLWSSGHNSDYMMGHTNSHNGNPDFYDTTFVLNYMAANPDHTLVKLECGGYTGVVLVDVGGGELRVFGFGQNAQYQLGTNNNSRVDNTMKESILYTQYAQANDTRVKLLRASWYSSGVLFENGVIMCTGNGGKFMANDNVGNAHNTLREATHVQSYCAANACEVVDFAYTNDAIFVLFSNGRLGGNGRAVGDNTNVADFKEVTLMERLDGELADYEVTLIRCMYNTAIARLTHKTTKTEQWWMTGENYYNGAGAAANQTYYTDWTRCTKLEELLATFADPLDYTYVQGGLHRGASVVVDHSTDKVYRIGYFDHIPQMASATGDFVEQTTYINKAWLETSGLARLTNFTPTVWHFNGYGIFVGGHLPGEAPQTYSMGGSEKFVQSDLAIDDTTLGFVAASTTVYEVATRVWVNGHNSNNMLGTSRATNYSGWGFADIVETFLAANPTYKLLDMWSFYAAVLLLEIDGKLRLYAMGANSEHNPLGLNHTTTSISTPESCVRFNAYADENHTAIKLVRLHGSNMSVLYENGKIMSSGYNAGCFLDGTATPSGSTLVEALLVTQYCEANNTEVDDFVISAGDACVLFKNGKVLGNGTAMGQTTNNNDNSLHETALNGIMGADYRCTLLRSVGSPGYVFRITHKTTGEEQWWGTGTHGDNNVCGGGGDKTVYTNEMGRMNKLETLLQSFADPLDYYYVEDTHFGATVVRDNATMKWYRIGHFYHITEWSNFQTTFVETTDYITESWLETDASAGFTPFKWKFGYYGFVIFGVELDSVSSTYETRPAYDGYVRRLLTTLSGVGAGASLYAYATTQTAGVGASEMRGYAATGDPKVVSLEVASDGDVKVDLQQVVDGAGELGPASAAPEVGVVVYVVNEDGAEDLHVLSPIAAEGYVAGTPYPSITSAFFDAASGQLKVSAAVYDAFDEYHLLAFLGEPTEGSDPLALPAGATMVSATNASKAIKELALTLSEVYDSDAFGGTAALASGQTMTVRLVAAVDGAAVAHADLAHTNHKFVEVASAAFEESGELSVAFELTGDAPDGLTTVVVASDTALTHAEVLAYKSDANVAFAPSDAIARVATAEHPDGFVPVDATSAVHVYVVVFKNELELHYLHTQASRPESRVLVQTPKFDDETGAYTGVKLAHPLVANIEVLTFAMILDDTEARAWSFNVGAAGGKYVFGGDVTGEQPTLRVQIGDSLVFDVNAVGHPFWIKSVDVAGTSHAVEGVANNGLDKALVAWSPSAKGTYYYRCEFHSSMRGVIEVTDRVSKDTLDATRVDQLIASVSEISGDLTIAVSAANGKYVFAGDVVGEQPTVYLRVGDTVTFQVNAATHPFYIKTVSSTGDGNVAEGVVGNGTESGTVTWSPSAAGTFFYNCGNHSSMHGVIEVSVPGEGSNANVVDAAVDLESVATANALFVGDGFALTKGLTPGGDPVALAGKTQLAYVTAVRTPTDEVYGAARILFSEKAVRGDDFSYTVQDGHGRLHTRSATAFHVDSTAGGWRWIQWDFMTNVGLGRIMEWSTDRNTAHRYEPFSFFDKASPSNGQGLMDFYLSLHPDKLDIGGGYWSTSVMREKFEFGPNYGLHATNNHQIVPKGARTAFPAAGMRHRIEVIEHETDADAYDLMYTMRELDTNDLMVRTRFSYLQHEGTTFGTPSGGPRGIPKTCETLQIRYSPYSGSYPAIKISDVVSRESGQELVPYARLR